MALPCAASARPKDEVHPLAGVQRLAHELRRLTVEASVVGHLPDLEEGRPSSLCETISIALRITVRTAPGSAPVWINSDASSRCNRTSERPRAMAFRSSRIGSIRSVQLEVTLGERLKRLCCFLWQPSADEQWDGVTELFGCFERRPVRLSNSESPSPALSVDRR